MQRRGEWIELREDEGHGCYVTEEVFFHGHCEEDDLDWVEVAEATYYYECFEYEITDDELATRLRDDYGRIQHVYGRKVPSGDGWWRWSWQRNPGRGAFKVTRLVSRWEAWGRRARRRRVAAAKRAARERWPMAEITYIWPGHGERRTEVRMRFEGLQSLVTWHVGDEMVTLMGFDVDAWKERYQGKGAA